MGDHLLVCCLHVEPSHLAQLSLAIPPWVRKMYNNSYSYRWGINGQLCVTAGGPVTVTTSILIPLVKGAGVN